MYEQNVINILISFNSSPSRSPLFFSCHVAHNASTQFHQPALSSTAICTSLQLLHPVHSLSLSTVLLHVVFGLPCFRRPYGVQVNVVLQSLLIILVVSSWCGQWIPIFFAHLRWDYLYQPSAGLLTNSFLPAYLKYFSKTSALEDIDFVFITFIHLSFNGA